jgi:hypothetical protein
MVLHIARFSENVILDKGSLIVNFGMQCFRDTKSEHRGTNISVYLCTFSEVKICGGCSHILIKIRPVIPNVDLSTDIFFYFSQPVS